MKDKITYKDLVHEVAENTNQSEKSTDGFIHQIADVIEDSLENGDPVSVANFGKFELRWTDERKGRNPQTGEVMTIPGQNRVYFKPYKVLREKVNRPFSHLESFPVHSASVEQKDDNSQFSESTGNKLSISDEVSSPIRKSAAHSSVDGMLIVRPKPLQPAVVIHPQTINDKTSSVSVEDLLIERDHPSLIHQNNTADKTRYQPEPAQSSRKPDRLKRAYTAALLFMAAAMLIIVLLLFQSSEQPNLLENSVTGQAGLQVPEPIPEQTLSSINQENGQPEAESTQSSAAYASLPSSESYTISRGETLWSVSENEYNDPYLWPVIYRENRDWIENPNEIYPNRNIQLPGISDSDELSAPERRAVALGYISVYDWLSANEPDSGKFVLWTAGYYSMQVLQDVSDKVDEDDYSYAIQNR